MHTFQAQKRSTVTVHKTVKEHFDPEVTWPPTEAQVNKSTLNICLRMLELWKKQTEAAEPGSE